MTLSSEFNYHFCLPILIEMVLMTTNLIEVQKSTRLQYPYVEYLELAQQRFKAKP